MKTVHIKRLLVRYAWVGRIVGLVVTFLFGTGIIWKYFDYDLKSRSAKLEQTRVERELYERLLLIQNDVSSAIPQYVITRDMHIADAKNYQIQNAYTVAEQKLVNLISQYNRLEVKLSSIERRSPRFFVIPVPPTSPTNFKLENSQDGKDLVITFDYQPDQLQIDVTNDVKTLFEQNGRKFPSGEVK